MKRTLTPFLAAALGLGLVASHHSPAPAHDHIGPGANESAPMPSGPDAVEAQSEEPGGGESATGEEPEKFDFPEAGDARIIGEEEIQRMLKTHGSEMIVVNFWATWCGPCVAELPYFVKLSKELEEEQIRFIGVSVDFDNVVEDVVIPFLRRREIPYSNVVYFGDQDTVIRTFSEEWTGAIPATFFFDAEGNKLGEILTEVSEEELREHVERNWAKVEEAREQAAAGE